MNDTHQPFETRLKRQRRLWQAGVLLCGALRLLRLAVLVFASYVLLDYLLAFSSPALMAMNGLCLSAVVFLLAWELISTVGVTREETAVRMDQLMANRRQPVLTALELQSAAPATDELRGFLVEKAMGEAVREMEEMSAGRWFPWPEVGRQTFRLFLTGALAAVLLAVHAPATETVLARIRHPQADIPPYSPYHFSITPAVPRVLYGGSVDLRVQVAGGAVRQGVEMWTRHAGEVNRVPCFREGESLFSQRLDRVTDPVEFCFVTGRARSEWHRVELRMQPKVSMVKLRIAPPAYTHLPAREFVLGEEGFEGYKGSRARLQLTSNRPLARGALTLTPLDGIGGARLVTAEKTGEHTLAFDWDLRQPARIEVRVHDTQGTAMAEPLRLTQKLIPDLPPEVSIHTPPPYALATPSSLIPVQGSATDDLALRSVELVRTMVGFRDRVTSVGPKLPDKRYAISHDFNLRRLGVLPGQIIELGFEARDFNPDRTGIGASDLVRIEIIPEAEYAEIIRANETLDQFLARFHAVQQKLDAFNEAVEALNRELAEARPDAGSIGQWLDQARRHNQALQELVSKLGEEFHAYDLEAAFAAAVRDMAEKLQGQANLLEGMKPGNPQLPEVTRRLMADIKEQQGRLRQEVAQAEKAVKVGRVMEQASAFMEILSRQRQVVRRLQRFDPPTNADSAELGYYGKHQAEVQEALRALLKELPEAAQGLPEGEEYTQLRQDTLEFARQLQETGADQLMNEAVSASGNQDGPKAHRSARLALERLEGLLKKRGDGGCQFAGLCQGGLKFSPGEELRSTLAQMLSSMMGGGNKPGERGLRGGGGGTGDGSDGYWVPSHTRLNTPVFGPQRMTFKPGGAQGSGGRGGVGGQVIGQTTRETITGPKQKPVQGGARSPELAPAKYRDAVKRYFDLTEGTR